MTEWEIVDRLTHGDVSRFGFTYREAFEWLIEHRQQHRSTWPNRSAAR